MPHLPGHKSRLGQNVQELRNYLNQPTYLPISNVANQIDPRFQNALTTDTYLNPNRPKGYMSDMAFATGLLGEGLDTGLNKFMKNVVDPTFKYLAPNAYDMRYQNLDTTFDPIAPAGTFSGMPFEQIPDAGFASSAAKAAYDEQFRASKDSDYQNPYQQLSNGAYATAEEFFNDPLIAGGDGGIMSAVSPTAWADAIANSKLDIKGSNQSTVTDIVKQTNNPDLTEKSDDLGKQTDQKDNIDPTDKEQKKGWLSGLQTGINNFLDRLDEPGFQTALAMHMEAKGGGDITDVLFAGVKTSNKAKTAAFTAHMNELKLQEMEVNIASKTKKLTTPTQPTDSMKGIVKSLLAKYDLKDRLEGASLSIASRAMEYVDAGMSEIDAANQAMKDAEGALTPDRWFDQFIGKGGGEFDITKMAPAGGTQVQYFADAAGRTVIFDGTSYRYADGTPYTPGE
tara:strand:- start:3935 stop:5293 length:1359 start_codon:yes stop_codon:yes gene_type:complete